MPRYILLQLNLVSALINPGEMVVEDVIKALAMLEVFAEEPLQQAAARNAIDRIQNRWLEIVGCQTLES